MAKTELVTFAVSVLTILNPLGNATLFESMTGSMDAAKRRSVLIRCAVAVAVILLVTVWLGDTILNLFGVSVATLELGGGLLIAGIAFSMIHSKSSSAHSTNETLPPKTEEADIAVVPLAIPIVAGPGAIATVIVNAQNFSGIAGKLEMSVIVVAGSLVVALSFWAAGALQKLLGAQGMDVLSKIMGMILLAIAVGMVANGASSLFPVLAGS